MQILITRKENEKMAKKKETNVVDLWEGITEADCLNEDYIESEDIVDYNIPAMTSFVQNVNIFRQLTMEKDGLKPIERRILYTMYESGAYRTSKNDRKPFRKSSKIVADVMSIHAHGDGSIYNTLVNNGQYWKNAVPLIVPSGNFANISDSDMYAHMRYTEALVSYYGYCCFFKDLDKDCLEMIPSTTGGDRKEDDEPLALPSRYPNILVNGGFGMASGNLFFILAFAIVDISSNIKKILRNPEITSVYMVPDFPTGCDIIDSDDGIRSFCEKGKGSVRLRATIDIEQEKNGDWILKIKNVPWSVNFANITKKILELIQKNILQIKTIADHSTQIKTPEGIKTILDYWIILDKSHDPYQTRTRLYKLTQLEKPLAIDFNIVTNDFQVDRPSLRGLIQMWIDSRREYKRRLYAKTLVKLNARISLLKILIYLTKGANIDKTISIVRTHSLDDAIPALMKMQSMNSYQATQIYNMPLKTFNKNAHEQFKDELEKCEIKLKEIMDIIHSTKKIDEIIADELDELKEWQSPRRCRLISEDTAQEVANTDHTIIVTKQNLIKKIAYKQEAVGKPLGLGTFKNGDFPKLMLMKANNLENVTFFDMYGRFSTVPVHAIDSTPANHVGNHIYNFTKLNGPIISCMNNFNPESIKFLEEKANTKLSIVSLSATGYIKATPIQEFMNTRNWSNAVYAKVRENDYIVYADILMDISNVLIYSKKGDFAYIQAKDIPSQTKQGTGLSCIKLGDMDECVGLTIIGKADTHLIVITEKGLVKRCEIDYLGKPGKRKVSSYLSTLEAGDNIVWVGATNEEDDETLGVFTRTEYIEIPISDIPVQARKAKGKKLISMPLGSNLIDVRVY